MADAKKLTTGAEIIQGTMERRVEVKVGDNFREIMNVGVLIEDDKVIAIRANPPVVSGRPAPMDCWVRCGSFL